MGACFGLELRGLVYASDKGKKNAICCHCDDNVGDNNNHRNKDDPTLNWVFKGLHMSDEDKVKEHKPTIMPACYCVYFKCNGQMVDSNTKKCHARYDTSQSYYDLAEVGHQ
jgi:hypothetical protein